MAHIKNILKNISKNLEISKEINLDLDQMDVMEYIKWLSYVSDAEKNRMNQLAEKKISDLTSSELLEMKRFQQERKILGILNKYGKNKGKEKDILCIREYIEENSIEKIMKRKLTVEERVQANRLTETFSTCPEENIYNLVTEWQNANVYQSLSMVQAYTLHQLILFLNENKQKKLVKQIHQDSIYKFPQRQKLAQL